MNLTLSLSSRIPISRVFADVANLLQPHNHKHGVEMYVYDNYFVLPIVDLFKKPEYESAAMPLITLWYN
jgi:hypothetical protein